MPVTEVVRTIRHAKRYAEILDVLVRNGFADVIAQFGLDRMLERGSRFFGGDPAITHTLSRPERMRVVLEQLGPTFMKLGQMLSCREDLIPTEWALEFAKLQAEGPKLPFNVIQETLVAEFEERVDEIFASIEEEPIAAASMAQVHRAHLIDGTPVVLKVLRPGSIERTQSDLEILQVLAGMLESRLTNTGFSPTEIVREFARELKREVDFTFEGRSTDKLRKAFDDHPRVRFPRVYWEATTKHVLALEEFTGFLLSRLQPDDLTAEQRSEVVALGATAVARQRLELGFFHADPHPGNLFAMVDDDGAMTVGFIDCGMTGRIEHRTMEQLAFLVKAVAEADVESAIDAAGTLASIPQPKMDDPVFRADMAELVHSFEVGSIAQFDLPGLLETLFATMRAHRLHFPAQLVLLIKALTTIESVGRSLDPTFDLIAHIRPSIERIVKQRYGWSALTGRFQSGIAQYASLIEEIPREIKGLLSTVRRNNFAVNLQHRGLTQMTRTIEHASRNIGFALMVTGLTVSSAILIHASGRTGRVGLETLGIIGFVLATLMGILYTLGNRKWLAQKRDAQSEDD